VLFRSASVLGNHAAGIVVGQVGAATPSPEGLREAISLTPAQPIEELQGLA
jgi:bifunctional ADP-heptose synthase (sugar kinase/adenylyltransferase)